MGIGEQTEYVEDLVQRVTHASADAPAVCHLDTGVLRARTLLEGSLAPSDHHSIFVGPGADVHPHGHGTSMASLALFGNIEPLLTGRAHVALRHRLELVRMQPGPGEQRIDPLDYGTATVEVVSHPEVSRPDRRRTFCLKLSTDPDEPNEPTLWSASVDALICRQRDLLRPDGSTSEFEAVHLRAGHTCPARTCRVTAFRAPAVA